AGWGPAARTLSRVISNHAAAVGCRRPSGGHAVAAEAPSRRNVALSVRTSAATTEGHAGHVVQHGDRLPPAERGHAEAARLGGIADSKGGEAEEAMSIVPNGTMLMAVDVSWWP